MLRKFTERPIILFNTSFYWWCVEIQSWFKESQPVIFRVKLWQTLYKNVIYNLETNFKHLSTKCLKKKVNIKSQFLTSPFGATIALMKSATELRVYSLGKVVFLKGGF